MVPLINRSKNQTIATTVEQARGPWQRLRGLIGRSDLAPETAFYIPGCTTIHTCFMRFPIDAVFVSKNLEVTSLYRNLKPWRMTKVQWGARSVIELAAGTINKMAIEIGDQLHVDT
jgi:uncharacterized membrane protein (UPF0127 family)